VAWQQGVTSVPRSCGSVMAIQSVTGGADSIVVNRGNAPSQAFLGDYVTLAVCHVDSLLARAQGQQLPLSLFVNGVDAKLPVVGVDAARGALTFILDRTARNKAEWAPILYNPLFERTVAIRVSVGVQGGQALPALAPGATALVLEKLWTDAWTILAGLVILLGWSALIFLARRTDVLRNGPPIGGVRQPYSLGRAQMAWWFALGFGAFVFIWVVDGATDTISPSLLALMGVSAATGIAASLLTPSAPARLEAWRAARARETRTLVEAGGRAAPGSRGDEMVRTSNEMPSTNDEAPDGVSHILRSQGFWRDILTDDHGVLALDRLQMVCWTAALSVVYLYSVLWTLEIPEFSATLLLLIGVSSGTYLGFKLPGVRGR